MSLVTSLLTAIVRADGDALVLHAGERPYVVAPKGQTELASRVLTFDAMKGMLKELLSSDAQRALAEFGAVQHELQPPGFAGSGTFTVIAARGGDDIWIEIRRHRVPVAPAAPAAPVPPPPSVTPAPPAAAAPPPVVSAVPVSEPEPEIAPEPQVQAVPPPPVAPEIDTEPDAWQIELTAESLDGVGDESQKVESVESREVIVESLVIEEETVTEIHEISLDVGVASMVGPSPADEAPAAPAEAAPPAAVELETSDVPVEAASVAEPKRKTGPVEVAPAATVAPPPAEPEPRPAVVLPIARPHVRVEHPARFPQPVLTSGIDRLLRTAAARGASTLYLTSQARPSIRVEGEISAIDGEAVLGETDVESLILDIIPDRNREALRGPAGTEWICDVPEVGRIRCVTFRDHRGVGAIFRMIPARAISAEQLGLSREIQGLCAEADGLILVAGPKASGKSTLLAAFVDLINRTRSDHVIAIETQIRFVHENRLSLVSQREARGDADEMLLMARAALREDPDVLVIEDFGSPDIVTLALEAAQSGQMVIGALAAHTAAEAVERIIGQTPPERRAKVQQALAENLRGIVAQVLLRKAGGGRVAAREVLLNTRAVANVIAEGKTSQLPTAIDSGRKHGMVALNDALVAFVQAGVVDSREAFRRAADQQGFLAQLRRQGIDTSFVERLA